MDRVKPDVEVILERDLDSFSEERLLVLFEFLLKEEKDLD